MWTAGGLGREGWRRLPQWLLVGAVGLGAGCYSGVGAGQTAGPTNDTDGGSSADLDAGGDGGDGGSDDGSDDGVAAQCNDAPPPPAALLRMNRTTYVNALTDVFGADAIGAIQIAVDAMPQSQGGVFASETQAPTYAEVSASVDIAGQLAFALTRDAAALAALDPCLTAVPAGADPSNDTCLSQLLETTGRRLLRRPLTDQDRARLTEDFAVGGEHSVAEGVATLLIALLIDPEFLYYAPPQGEALAADVAALSPHQTAAKLARVLWNSLPDEALLDAADAGLPPSELAAQVQRMLDDPRARAATARFYYDWLELERLPFPAEALFPDPEVRKSLRAAMETELLDFAQATTLDRDGTYADLLLDRTAVVPSPELAALYGVPAGGAEVQLPQAERAGMLTRAGFLATPEIRGSNAGHLIKRGARLSRVICRPLPLPDPSNFPQSDPADPQSDPDAGIRQRFAAATAEPTCMACHAQLDGMGAPFGHYGSAGEWIDLETIALADGQTNDLPIDTASQVQLDDGTESVADGIALSERLAESGVGAQCMAQQLTRNIVARPLQPDDACMVDVAIEVLAPQNGEAGSIRQALVQLVMSTHFRTATIQ